MIPTVIKILSILTVIGELVVTIVFILSILKILGKNVFNVQSRAKWGILLAFSAALISTLGSLFFSEVAHYKPCELCWFQRIFMYPQVFILAIAWWKHEYKIYRHAVPLSIIGGSIALYHSIEQYIGISKTQFCSLQNSASCLTRYVFDFGFVTIPIMALTGFLLILTGTLLWKKLNDQSVANSAS